MTTTQLTWIVIIEALAIGVLFVKCWMTDEDLAVHKSRAERRHNEHLDRFSEVSKLFNKTHVLIGDLACPHGFTCPKCKGVPDRNAGHQYNAVTGEWTKHDLCEYCEGTGKVDAKKIIEYRK